MKKVSKKVSWEIIKKSFLPFLFLFLFFAGYGFYRINILPKIPLELQINIKKYILTVLILCIAFVIQRIAGAILGWYQENFAAKTKTHLDDDLVPIIRRTSKVIIWIIAFLIILPLPPRAPLPQLDCEPDNRRRKVSCLFPGGCI